MPRELRDRLKRAKGAKGLLRDLEGQIREFVVAWEGEGGAAGGEKLEGSKDMKNSKRTASTATSPRARKSKDTKKRSATPTDADPTSSDEEIVFVGRNGSMKDVPPSPHTPHMTPSTSDFDSDTEPASPDMVKIRTPVKRHGPLPYRPGASSAAAPSEKHEPDRKKDGEDDADKLLLTSPLDDPTARFARYLVHALAAYYDLRAYSVTRDGEPKRREAYVGLKSGVGMGVGAGAGVREDGKGRGMDMPAPLWGLV